jgi:hypothetical protein
VFKEVPKWCLRVCKKGCSRGEKRCSSGCHDDVQGGAERAFKRWPKGCLRVRKRVFWFAERVLKGAPKGCSIQGHRHGAQENAERVFKDIERVLKRGHISVQEAPKEYKGGLEGPERVL